MSIFCCALLEHIGDLVCLCKLASVNRFGRGCVFLRRLVLDDAKEKTGYSSVPFDEKRKDFWYMLGLLLCPWMSVPQTLAVIPMSKADIAKISVCTDEITFYGINGPESVCYRAPAYPGDHKWSRVSADGSIIARNVPKVEEVSGMRKITVQIHKAVIAFVEIRGEDLINQLECIYFYTSSVPRRMIRCLQFPGVICNVDMETAPCSIWILNSLSVYFYGPRDDRMINTNISIEPVLLNASCADELIPFLNRLGTNMINHRGMYCGRTLLHLAISKYIKYAIRPLIEAGADPELPDGNGMTPLVLAASCYEHDLIPLLADYVNPNAPFVNGFTPFHTLGDLATGFRINRIRSCIRALLKCGCDPLAVSPKYGNNAMDYWESRGFSRDEECWRGICMK